MSIPDDNKKSKKFDECNWEELFKNNYSTVYNKAYYIVLNEEMAEEITQIAFMKAFIYVDQLRDINRFRSWICRIAVNIAKDTLKEKANERNRSISLYDTDGNIKESIEKLINFNDPEVEYETLELIRITQDCAKALCNTDRRILYLKYIEGYTYEEIAELMNINRNTVGTKILRAKKKIYAELKSQHN